MDNLWGVTVLALNPNGRPRRILLQKRAQRHTLIDPAGTYSLAGASAPTTDPAGTYSLAGASAPTTDPAGTYSVAEASAPTLAAAGTYILNAAASRMVLTVSSWTLAAELPLNEVLSFNDCHGGGKFL